MFNPQELIGTLIENRYQLTRFLRQGGYGLVYEANELVGGRFVSRVAVKIVIPVENDEHFADVVHNEIQGLAQLAHENVIGYRASGTIDFESLRGAVYLTTELGDTSLSELVQSPAGISMEELRAVASGVASALAHLHAKRVVHRDVKPSNILRVDGRWKLADFGLVCSIDGTQPSANADGTPSYLAPEVLSNQWNEQIDVYSFGVTMLECLTGELAHDGANQEEFLKNLQTLPPRIPADLPPPWNDLISRCLERDPTLRLTATQIEALLPSTNPGGAIPSPRVGEIVVSGLGQGNTTSLVRAIRQAAPGTRIVVKPGIYRETLVLHGSVEIVGDGPVHEIIVETTDAHCIEMHGETASIRGVMFQLRSPENNPVHAVDVSAGVLRMEDCTIQSEGLSCVSVHGSRSAVELNQCRIQYGSDVGIYAYDGAHMILEHSTVSGHSRAGAVVGEGGRLSAMNSRFQGSAASGVHVYSRGVAELDGCRIQKNGRMGVVVGRGGAATLHDCQIQGNHQFGVACADDAQLSMTECQLSGNRLGEQFRGAELTATVN